MSNAFVLIDNDGIDPISGTFLGLDEGVVFTTNLFNSGLAYFVTYSGGDGNDVVLQPLPGPTCVEDLFERQADGSFILAQSLLTANDVARIGGALTVTSVGPAASGRATVALENESIVYQPNPGYEGSDSFQLTIHERGGGATICQVVLFASGDEAAGHPAKAIEVDGDVVGLRFTGIPGRRYSFQVAENMMPNVLNWIPGGAFIADAEGNVVITILPQFPSAIYRLTYP